MNFQNEPSLVKALDGYEAREALGRRELKSVVELLRFKARELGQVATDERLDSLLSPALSTAMTNELAEVETAILVLLRAVDASKPKISTTTKSKAAKNPTKSPVKKPASVAKTKSKRGGARPGAGRKPKASAPSDPTDAYRCAWTNEHGDRCFLTKSHKGSHVTNEAGDPALSDRKTAKAARKAEREEAKASGEVVHNVVTEPEPPKNGGGATVFNDSWKDAPADDEPAGATS